MQKLKENRSLLIVGIICLVVLVGIVGYTYSFFQVKDTDTGSITGTVATADLSVVVNKLSPNTNVGLIPQLDEYITNAVIGREGKSCTDDNGSEVCQVYAITVTNNSNATVFVNGTVDIDNKANPNLKWARINGTEETILTSPTMLGSPKLVTNNILTMNDKFIENEEKIYYIVLWISETNDAQEDTGTFSGTVTFDTSEKDAIEITGADGQFKYTLVGDNKIQLSRYLGSETDVVIPATYDGYQVYSVGNIRTGTTAATRYNIFGDTTTTNTTVKSITLSEGIEVIEMGAFSKCTGLSGELNLPESLKVIGHTAFNGCTGLTGDLEIPDGVEVIDIGAFQNCSGFNGTLTLPNSLKTIGQNAFFKCTKLTGDLVIPEGVTTLQKNAFNTCSGFNGTLTLPSTLSVIGEYAFTDSTGLTGDLIIPEGVTKIEESAFQSLTGMTGQLSLPSTLVEIGPYAFAYDNGLTQNITIPNSVTKIGEGAFNGCSGFNGVLTLSSNLVEIGDFAFNHCSGLTNTTLDIPTGVKTIGLNETDGTHIFYDFATKTIETYTMNNLSTGIGTYFKVDNGVLYNKNGTRLIAYPANKVGNTYEIPEGVTILDELAFSRAGSASSSVATTGLKKIVLPNSYILSTTVPSNYLNKGNNLALGIYNQTGINEIGVKSDNPNYKTIDGILYSKDGTILWYVPDKKTGSINIPEGVTTIKSGAFYSSNSRNITSVTIPSSVTTIDSTELTELKRLGSSKVTFDSNCIYQFDASGNVVKS